MGLIFRIIPANSSLDADEFLKMNDEVFGNYHPDFSTVCIRPGSWESTVREIYTEGLDQQAGEIMKYAKARNNELRLVMKAIELTEEYLRIEPNPPPTPFKNLGIGYFYLSKTDPSVSAKMFNAWMHYLNVAPPDDPEIPAIRRVLFPPVLPTPNDENPGKQK